MAAITASMVKELREMTGAGMMDCKKALNETDGNMDEAVEFLRKNGQAKAEKKAGRIAAEGLCRIITNDNITAAVVEVNSETDFVAKNETFQQYVDAVAKQALASDAADLDAFMAEKWILDDSKTVKEALVEKIAVIGENLTIRRFQKVTAANGCVVTYLHGGGSVLDASKFISVAAGYDGDKWAKRFSMLSSAVEQYVFEDPENPEKNIKAFRITFAMEPV